MFFVDNGTAIALFALPLIFKAFKILWWNFDCIDSGSIWKSIFRYFNQNNAQKNGNVLLFDAHATHKKN